MRSLLRMAALIAFGLSGPAPGADAPRLFQTGSLDEIRQHHRGRPFVLALWSLTCSHCARELAQFAALKKQYPRFALVLVSTDTPDEAAVLASTLTGYGLGGVESWVFADNFSERLRYAIDPQWAGELPRTYLFDGAHKMRGITGRIPDGTLNAWLTP